VAEAGPAVAPTATGEPGMETGAPTPVLVNAVGRERSGSVEDCGSAVQPGELVVGQEVAVSGDVAALPLPAGVKETEPATVALASAVPEGIGEELIGLEMLLIDLPSLPVGTVWVER